MTPLPNRAPTLLNQVIENLRHAIMVGELQPGERLPESDLCRRMQVSRPTMREALRCLEAERLVVIVPNRGPSVAQLSIRDVEEIHEVWGLLTVEATVRFAGLVQESDIAEMKRSIARLKALKNSSDVKAQLDAIYGMFRVVFIRCNNRVWNEMILRLISRINFLRSMALKTEGTVARSVEELNAIVAAVESQDPEVVRRVTRAHIDAACVAARRQCLQETRRSGTLLPLNGSVDHGKVSKRVVRNEA